MSEAQIQRLRALAQVVPDCDAFIQLQEDGRPGFMRQSVLAWVNAAETIDSLIHNLQLQTLRGADVSTQLSLPRDAPPESLLWLPVLWSKVNKSHTGRAQGIGTVGIHSSIENQVTLPRFENAVDLLIRGLLLATLQPGGAPLSDWQAARLIELSGPEEPDGLTLIRIAAHWLTYEVALDWGLSLPETPGMTVSEMAYRYLVSNGTPRGIGLSAQFDAVGWVGTQHLFGLPSGLASAVMSEARVRLKRSAPQRRGMSRDWEYQDAWHLMDRLREGSPGKTSARRHWKLRQTLENFFATGGVILPHDAAFMQDLETQVARHNLDYGFLPESYLLSPELLASLQRHREAGLIRKMAKQTEAFC